MDITQDTETMRLHGVRRKQPGDCTWVNPSDTYFKSRMAAINNLGRIVSAWWDDSHDDAIMPLIVQDDAGNTVTLSWNGEPAFVDADLVLLRILAIKVMRQNRNYEGMTTAQLIDYRKLIKLLFDSLPRNAAT